MGDAEYGAKKLASAGKLYLHPTLKGRLSPGLCCSIAGDLAIAEFSIRKSRCLSVDKTANANTATGRDYYNEFFGPC